MTDVRNSWANDGDTTPANYLPGNVPSNGWLQLDIESVHEVDTINLLHYSADSRTYYCVGASIE